MAELKIRRLGYALGAEVTGVDLRQPLDDGTVAALREAWMEHLVLVLPGQDITPEQHVAFSRRFGQLDPNDATPYYRHPEHPEVLVVSNKPVNGKPSETRNTGRNWHSDLSYTGRPAMGSLLLCKERPDVGGDTMFANQYLAYETLSPRMRAFIDSLEAVHDVTLVKGIEQRSPELVAEIKRINPPIAHPVVRIHPESGRAALFVSQRVRHFVGLSDEESEPILRFLTRHAVRDEFVYRHRWTVNDLVMWDNRATMHVALADFDQSKPRHMLRCSIQGEPLGYVYQGDDSAAAAKPEATHRSVVASVS
ncbi:taurine dioxygenase [Allostella sp. ATCC 35155]|nr:taurine dioxygenase [Stella sp. ATCC 35155]